MRSPMALKTSIMVRGNIPTESQPPLAYPRVGEFGVEAHRRPGGVGKEASSMMCQPRNSHTL